MALFILVASVAWLRVEAHHSAAAEPLNPTPAVATTSVVAPSAVLIGTQLTFKVVFNNSGGVGFGPFADIVLDAGGANMSKPCPCDGLTFVSAKFVGVNGPPINLTPVSPPVLTTPCGSSPTTVPHPFASSGIQPVSLPAGAQFITLALPFGSFYPPQSPMEIEVTANVSNLADLNYPLKIYARTGFRFGSINPLDDPGTDPPILSDQTGNSTAWAGAAQTTPKVLVIKKTYRGPEGETATGPNFIGSYPLKYDLTVDVAPGQTLTNVTLTDCLPDNMSFHQLVSITPGPSSAPILPPIDVPSSSGCLIVKWNSLSGSATVTFEFFIPENDALGNPVLSSSCVAVSKNPINLTADRVPLDPCDQPQQLSEGPVFDKLLDKCLAIQKSAAIIIDTGTAGLTPGDTVRHTFHFQVSGYKTLGQIVIKDFLSNGQDLDLSAPVLLTVSDQFGTKSGFVNPSFITQTSDPNGATHFCPPPLQTPLAGTVVKFDISAAMPTIPMFAAPRLAAGILTGGYAAGTGPPNTAATGVLTFRVKIRDDFQFPVSPGDKYVDKEDPMNDCVRIEANVLQNLPRPSPINTPINIPGTVVTTAQDDSAANLMIVGDTLVKTVYEVTRANTLGVFNPVCGPSGPACSNSLSAPQEVRPGDRVTFRLEKTIPSGDAEKLTVQDFLPLPIFDVNGPPFAMATCPPQPPGPGQACKLPSHTLPITPTFIPDPSTNSLTFDYGTFFNTTNAPGKIDLLFTATVTTQPFGDGLYLTNEAQECESNTFGETFCQRAIAQVNVREPKLKIRKAVVNSSNTNAVFTPAPPAPSGVVFNSTGYVSGIINSTGPNNSVASIDSNVSNVDANDFVTFAITIENVGGSPAYDVKIQDMIPTDTSGNPSCFTIVPNSFQVKRGTGAIVNPALYSITMIPSTGTPVGFAVTSTASLPIPIAAYNPVSGANIVVITFKAQMLPNVLPNIPPDCCKNWAEIKHYSSVLNGPDFVAGGFTQPFSDEADVCVNPTLTKSVRATSEAYTGPQASTTPQTPANTPQVTIGEIVHYQLLVALPEGGVLNNFEISDALPAGMQFMNDSTARVKFIANGILGGITRTGPLSLPAFSATGNAPLPSTAMGVIPFPSALITPGSPCGSPATPVKFSLSNIQNTDSDNDLEYVQLEFNALVCNDPNNQDTAPPLANTFSITANGTSLGASNAIAVKIVEPKLTLTKTVSPTSIVQGGTVTYNVTIHNPGPIDASDVQFSDVLGAGLSYVSPTTVGGACAGAVASSTSPSITCTSVPANGNVTIQYKAVANPATCPATLPNQATVTWTSLPGLQGTTTNPTGSHTPGSSGAPNGERNGATAPLAPNDYAASTSIPLTVTCPPCTQNIPSNMSAWFPFDEQNGSSTVNDIAGFNNQGVPKPASPIGSANAPTAVPGRVGGALNFSTSVQPNGSNVEVPDHSEINFGAADFSIDAWVSLTKPPSVYVHPIVDKLQLNNAGTQGTGYALNLVSSFATGARLRLVVGNGGPLATYWGPNLPSVPFGTWTHVAVTVSRVGSGTVIFYVNGNPLPATGPSMPTGSFNSAVPLLIGESRLSGWQGAISIDELELFKKVLTQTEIQNIVNAGGGGKCKCYQTTNEAISCGTNGAFNYTLTITNLSNFTVTSLVFSPVSNITITPSNLTIPPLLPGSSTNVTVTISGPDAVPGANICLFIGLVHGPPPAISCRVQHCITLPNCPVNGSLVVTKNITNTTQFPFPSTVVFPVTVTCQPSGYSQTLSLSPSLLTQTFNNIPIGDSCTVIEGPLPAPYVHPACPSMEWANPIYSPGQSVTIATPGSSQTVSIQNTFFCDYACATQPQHMVSWWPLNEVFGNTVVDITGGHNGTTSSPIGSDPAADLSPKVNGALRFIVNSKATVSGAPYNFGTGNFSIDAWVEGPISNAALGIVDKLDTTGSTQTGFAFFVRNGTLRLIMGNTTYLSTTSFTYGTWQHVAVVVQRTSGSLLGTFYINGAPAGTFIPSAVNISNGVDLLIGNHRLNSGTCTSCEVTLDEIEIFNDIISGAQLHSIFAAGSSGKCP
jgi:uncharacterized repeat protein (TIGR01451 family)